MIKFILIQTSLVLLLTNFLSAQTSSLTSIYANGDTIVTQEYLNGDAIIRYFDVQNRLTLQLVNGIISKKIEYQRQDTIIAANLLLAIAPRFDTKLTYTFAKGDTVSIDIYSLKKKKISRKDCKKGKLVYFNDLTKSLQRINMQVCEDLKGKKKFVQVIKEKGKRLKQVDFMKGEKGNRFSDIEKWEIHWKDIIKTAGDYSLKIHNPWTLTKLNCYIKIIQKPQDSIIITNIDIPKNNKSDIVEVIETENYIVYDTLLLPILEEKVYLSPLLDIEKSPFQIINFTFPTSPLEAYWTYWIGVGEKGEEAFQKLEETVPADWSKPGVSKTMGAYAMEREIPLPDYTNPNIEMEFGNSYTMKRLQREINSGNFNLKKVPYFQKNQTIPSLEKTGYYLLIANKDYVNGYNVYIKIIAMQVVKESKERKIEK